MAVKLKLQAKVERRSNVWEKVGLFGGAFFPAALSPTRNVRDMWQKFKAVDAVALPASNGRRR